MRHWQAWTAKPPTCEGFYWFESDDKCPLAARADFAVIAYVEHFKGELYMQCPVGRVAVCDLSGKFAGPIPAPVYQCEFN